MEDDTHVSLRSAPGMSGPLISFNGMSNPEREASYTPSPGVFDSQATSHASSQYHRTLITTFYTADVLDKEPKVSCYL